MQLKGGHRSPISKSNHGQICNLLRTSGGNSSLQVRGAIDYWSEDYDQNQNCAQQDRIAELRAKVYLYQRIIVCIANILASASLLSQIPRLKRQERCKRAKRRLRKLIPLLCHVSYQNVAINYIEFRSKFRQFYMKEKIIKSGVDLKLQCHIYELNVKFRIKS